MGITPLCQPLPERGEPSEYFLEFIDGAWILERAGSKSPVHGWGSYLAALRESRTIAAGDSHGAVLVVTTYRNWCRHNESWHFPRPE